MKVQGPGFQPQNFGISRAGERAHAPRFTAAETGKSAAGTTDAPAKDASASGPKAAPPGLEKALGRLMDMAQGERNAGQTTAMERLSRNLARYKEMQALEPPPAPPVVTPPATSEAAPEPAATNPPATAPVTGDIPAGDIVETVTGAPALDPAAPA